MIFNKWIPWSQNNPLKFDTVQHGAGSGENKLAWELNGIVQKTTTSYDVVVENKKVEVKKLPKKKNPNISRAKSNYYINAGTKGSSSFSNARKELLKITQEIVEVFENINENEFLQFFGNDTKQKLDHIKYFVNHHASIMLETGVFTRGRILGSLRIKIGLFHILQMINELIVKFESCHDITHVITIDGKQYKINLNTYSKINELIGNGFNIPALDKSICKLSHWGFKNPNKFITKNWSEAVKASNVFDNVDIIAIVDRNDGYYLISKDQFDKKLIFKETVLMGQIRFNVEI